MHTSSIATAGLVASALFSTAAFTKQPKGEYLGTVPVDLAGEIQIPAAELGVVVTYQEDGSVYAYQAGIGKRGLLPRGCWGVEIGACCIGIYCSESAPGTDAKRDAKGGAQYDTVHVSGDRTGKITSLTVYPDRSMDMSVSKLDGHGNHVEYTCIGVHVSGCCIGVCVL
ncbi:hypothetical protein CCM_02174 [Cordyceps militaris CM01]|uniref:Uncharacterized protein n=1 Tax=Cordyceps militaris (strain CM01) TaxID=983644 RepID=G3J862_CORMM|nr:uncharacterized protein CCM_02174 [Cordyceps militaris CM01]EGX93904.1 hypothetical protein CCM_02174 [Cordyceps militaris CM01]